MPALSGFNGPVPDHWFEPIADHVGSSYLRYAHTKGTRQEVDHLVAALGLQPGMRVLDVGCGPGRHAHELARRGIAAHGIDISMRFVELARAGAPVIGGEETADRRRSVATFERLDARSMTFDREFDAAICLCQGAFGMMTAAGDDEAVLAGIARALRPGGALALTAFNAYFAVKYHHGATFDAAAGVAHERTTVHDEQGVPTEIDLWTGCYTPRELRLLLHATGCVVTSVSSVEPGRYGDAPATADSPEFLVIARLTRVP
jgi:SAM-dependent methyltransferase